MTYYNVKLQYLPARTKTYGPAGSASKGEPALYDPAQQRAVLYTPVLCHMGAGRLNSIVSAVNVFALP